MQAWWQQTLTDYILEPHHLKLLEAACDAWDRMVQARTTILKEGLTIQGRDSVKTHPAVAVERDSRIAFERTLRELGLDAPAEPPRPPQLPGYRR